MLALSSGELGLFGWQDHRPYRVPSCLPAECGGGWWAVVVTGVNRVALSRELREGWSCLARRGLSVSTAVHEIRMPLGVDRCCHRCVSFLSSPTERR